MPEAEPRGVAVKTECPSNLPEINADPGMLGQALLNLAHQCLPGDAERRRAENDCRADVAARVVEMTSRTPASASRPKPLRVSSTCISRPRRRAAASASRWSSASCSCMTERSKCSRLPGAARGSVDVPPGVIAPGRVTMRGRHAATGNRCSPLSALIGWSSACACDAGPDAEEPRPRWRCPRAAAGDRGRAPAETPQLDRSASCRPTPTPPPRTGRVPRPAGRRAEPKPEAEDPGNARAAGRRRRRPRRTVPPLRTAPAPAEAARRSATPSAAPTGCSSRVDYREAERRTARPLRQAKQFIEQGGGRHQRVEVRICARARGAGGKHRQSCRASRQPQSQPSCQLG